MLAVFWDSHDATELPFSRQYKSIIFYHNEEQKRLASASKASEEARRGAGILTEIVPAGDFYLAEEYHQKYYLQAVSDIAEEFKAIYPDFGDFINSTAVARVNGYIGGYGTPETLRQEIDRLGLSAAGKDMLSDLVASLKR